uniref:AT-rich interactive domain-containing protein 4A n=1 Tax=Salmo trutta TaxID=8032 RepID=A0A674F6E9_SALTR
IFTKTFGMNPQPDMVQHANEPAYLTVGTEVSAKYRGAFCEAKIKTVKRMVKVKVMVKGDTTSQVVQDDQVKGPLRVGSTVEVKSAEGICSEATINKLTDASWYTVVFDDGDEKTLRRTSLCLKGERHFAESETLDQLPLTNPEHFGTPVIGKKGNRGGRRSSQAHADDDKESSSSEDDNEDRRRLNDDLMGKVASVQTGTERTSWYLALVISPSCNDDLTVKKDQCLVRSFADSKFHTVARKEIHEVNMDSISKPEFSPRKGLDGAVHFLKTKVVPDSWKMDMSEILESSSSDEEDTEGKESDEEEEEEEEDEKEEDEEEEEKEDTNDEADPEERDHFLQQLYKFMEDRGTPINKPPVLGYKDLNLFKLFRLVYHQGGCDKIESGSVWKQIYIDLGIPVLNSAASYNVKTAYRKYLYGFEEYCRSACIVFRTIHHSEDPPASQSEEKAAQISEVKECQGPTPSVKTESAAAMEDKPAQEEAESGNESDKDVSSPRVSKSCLFIFWGVKEPSKLEKIKEKEEQSGVGETSGEETGGPRDCSRSDGGDTPGNRRSRRLEESDKESEDEEEEEELEDEEDGERRVGERGEDEDSEDSVTGIKVKVKYGRGKTQKIYEANIKKAENDDGGDVLYLVHYYGWNVRYDEWVKADRIIWPVDKGGTKNKQKKKVKNKEEGEKEDDKQGKLCGLKRGRPLLRTTPASANRSVSKTPSSEGRSSSKSKSDVSALPNGEGTPRRRTRRTSGLYDSDRDSTSNGRQDKPMVVLHCLPAEHIPSIPDLPTMDSDTDSATEEEICREERGVAKRKATEQRTPDKKVRLDRREEMTKMASPARRPADSPARRPADSPEWRLEAGGQRGEERLTPAKGKSEPEVKTEMPALTPEVQCQDLGEGGVAGGRHRSEQLASGVEEEVMPQIGPEALVCHEDLDDLDEKDKTLAEDLLMMMSQGKVHAPPPSNASSHQTHNNPLSSGGAAPPRVFSPTSAPSPDESHSTKSESDVPIEVDSVAGESQEGLGDNESANSNCFEASTSSSNSSMSLQERDTKDRGGSHKECSSAKKQKRNQKRPSTTSKIDKNGAGHSSDSEDLAVMDTSSKLTPVKHSMSKGSQKLVSPNSKELEKYKHKDKQSSFPSPRTYKWTFQLMSHTTASTSSGSSDTGMSPSSASPTQNTVAVECR